MRPSDPLAVFAALSGALAVIAGAFGVHASHGLAAELFRTGSQYQALHVVAALVALGRPGGRVSGWCFMVGSALFAGSLYALALGMPHWIGIVTPFGGLAMIAGWLVLAIGAWRGTDPGH